MSINFSLWELLNTTARHINNARQKELDKNNVTLVQAAVLRIALRLGDKATSAEISRQLVLKPNSISELLTRMKADGLVERVKDLKRKNLVRIHVTKKGQALHCEAENQESIDFVMSALSEEEKAQFVAILTKLREQAIKSLGSQNGD